MRTVAGLAVVLMISSAEAADPNRTQGPSRVLPPALESLTLLPPSVVGGVSLTGRVTMAGAVPIAGVTVTLTAAPERPRGFTIPATVKVDGSNMATFTIQTGLVERATTLTVSAAYQGAVRNATLMIVPLDVTSVACSPGSIYGGDTVSCQVNLNGPAPSGAVANVVSDHSEVATVAATVAITQTQSGRPPLAMPYSYVRFNVPTRPVATLTSVKIGASYGTDKITKYATFTVRPPALSSLSCSPTSVTGGSPVACRAALTGLAPSGGVTVTLSSDKPQVAAVPASVLITQAAENFTATTAAVPSTTSVTISAVYEQTKRATVEVKAPPLPDLYVHTFTFYDPQSGNGITGPQAGRPFKMCINVVNSGPGTSAASTLLVDLYRSGAGKINSWTRPVSALNPGTGANPCIDVQALAAGSTYDFAVSADAARVVTESNENNNYGSYSRGL